MELNHTTTEGGTGAGGLGPQKNSKDLERSIRALLSGCSDKEREVLLNNHIEEIEVFLESAKMEDTLLESFEHISRVSKTAKILLGRGSFGSVYLVKDTTTQVQFARKSIRIRGLTSPTKEIDIHRRLDHKNVVSFLGEDRDRKFVYIYLEYVNGGTLQERIEPSGMEENQVQFYFKQLIRGVKYLHSKKVAHRDLKPENLFLSRTEDLKIGDFGLAIEFEKDRYLWQVCGTSGYIAPEVFTGRYRGEPADVWSCGIILFQLLTGQKPWEDAQTKDVNFEIWSSSSSEMRLRSPWRSLSKKAFSLLQNILARKRKYRATLSKIKQNSWFQG
ncbi:serine/threonine-protein kinase grp-like [Oratosquilla oratoria]|uniref:serine/threonine-protein kinase grp-like n=1 Tax=Oratosquilla oratoria TaxID=337810 RepID=UPI003F7627A5